MEKMNFRGLLFAAASAVLFGLQPIPISFTYAGGSNGITMVFLRSTLALPALYLLLRLQGGDLRLERGDFRRIVILSMLGSALTSILLYSSYSFIPTGVATTLHFIYPLLVAVGCALIFHERFTIPKTAALILSTAGIVCFLSPDDVSLHPAGIALALLSGLCYAFYAVYMSASDLKRYHHFKLAFYTCLVVSIFSGLFGLASGQLALALTPTAWLFSLFVALFIGVAANCLFQLGVRYAGPSVTAILSTLEPITSVVVGCLFLHEGMTWLKLAGCASICIGVLLIAAQKAAPSNDTAALS